MRQPLLYTYTIPIDDGSAPNPFHGMCSLAICKPSIRRTAHEGDWVAGLGSREAPSGDLSGRLVYAMRVERVLSLQEYDLLAPKQWPHRIPDLTSPNLWDRLGDCIYDYSQGRPRQRASVHRSQNIKKDLSGFNVLISRDYYYFGSRALRLPSRLLPICHQTQGHRSKANGPYFALFVSWLRGLGVSRGLLGWPDYLVRWGRLVSCRNGCGKCRRLTVHSGC